MKITTTDIAIVTDGFWRKSLSAVRSLGAANYRVCVLGDSIFTTSFWSSYTSKRILVPDIKNHSSEFYKILLNFWNHQKPLKPILFPMEDETLMWLSDNREKMAKYFDFIIPPKKSLVIAQSKNLTMRIAKSLTIPIPKTYSFSSYEKFIKKIDAINNKKLFSKYLVKPISGSGSIGIIYLSSKLKQFDFKSHWDNFGPLLIQEKLQGNGKAIGVSLLMDKNSNCIASFVHQRIKQYPNSGGPSTQRISIVNKKLLKYSTKLLKKLNWKGVAMVEWKEDLSSGNMRLLEINPRFWGSLELAVRSGVNFPVLYADLSKDRKVESVHSYKTGVSCRWMFPGDILRYISEEKVTRESIFKFLTGLPFEAEEWNSRDLKGTLSSLLCPIFQVVKPKHWKFLFRK